MMEPLIGAGTAADLASQSCINICDLAINCATLLPCAASVPDSDTDVCNHQVPYRPASTLRAPHSPESD